MLMYTVKLVHLLLTLGSERDKFCSWEPSNLLKTYKKTNIEGCVIIFNLILAIWNFEVGKIYMAAIFKASQQDSIIIIIHFSLYL